MEKDQLGILLLRFVFYFTLLFSMIELFAGMASHSLLLIEESVHMFADSVSFGVNLWAELKSQELESKQLAQLIGTGVSFATLSGTLFAVLWESINRLSTRNLVKVDARVMLGFGIALSSFHASCLLAYFCGVNILHSHSHAHGHDHGHSHGLSSSVAKHEKTAVHKHSHAAHRSHGTANNTEELEELCVKDHGHEDLPDTDCKAASAAGTKGDRLEKEIEENPNLVSAMFHVFVDFLHSFLVIVTAGVVMFVDGKPFTTDETNETTVETDSGLSGRIDAMSSLLLCGIIFSGCVVLFKSFAYQYRVYRNRSYDAVVPDNDLDPLETGKPMTASFDEGLNQPLQLS